VGAGGKGHIHTSAISPLPQTASALFFGFVLLLSWAIEARGGGGPGVISFTNCVCNQGWFRCNPHALFWPFGGEGVTWHMGSYEAAGPAGAGRTSHGHGR
jgi:hypothetical protein